MTLGEGTHIFTLNPDTGEFCLTMPNIEIPKDTNEFAINTSNFRRWDGHVKAYIDDCLEGAEGPHGKNYNTRWIASLVAECHRIMVRGGIFLYPGDRRPAYRSGRLRLAYECNPIAFLVEQAGGAATNRRGTHPGNRTDRYPPARAPDFRFQSTKSNCLPTTTRKSTPRRNVHNCSGTAACSGPAKARRKTMSIKHPIISVTGSSGAGTTSVKKTFERIFNREEIKAAFIDGDAFHRYDRAEDEKSDGGGSRKGNHHFSHFGPEANLLKELESRIPRFRRNRNRQNPALRSRRGRREDVRHPARNIFRMGRHDPEYGNTVLRRTAWRRGDRRC